MDKYNEDLEFDENSFSSRSQMSYRFLSEQSIVDPGPNQSGGFSLVKREPTLSIVKVSHTSPIHSTKLNSNNNDSHSVSKDQVSLPFEGKIHNEDLEF